MSFIERSHEFAFNTGQEEHIVILYRGKDLKVMEFDLLSNEEKRGTV
jgi:hypothetical protein